jgi:hypothetical protein
MPSNEGRTAAPSGGRPRFQPVPVILCILLILLSLAENLGSWPRAERATYTAYLVGLLALPAAIAILGRGRARAFGYIVLLAAVVLPIMCSAR